MESKIENVISDKVKQEYERQLKKLQSQATRSCEDLKSCYESTLETLQQLKLVDATIFDFFERTNGNIRIVGHTTTFSDKLNIRSYNQADLINDNGIRLKKIQNIK